MSFPLSDTRLRDYDAAEEDVIGLREDLTQEELESFASQQEPEDVDWDDFLDFDKISEIERAYSESIAAREQSDDVQLNQEAANQVSSQSQEATSSQDTDTADSTSAAAKKETSSPAKKKARKGRPKKSQDDDIQKVPKISSFFAPKPKEVPVAAHSKPAARSVTDTDEGKENSDQALRSPVQDTLTQFQGRQIFDSATKPSEEQHEEEDYFRDRADQVHLIIPIRRGMEFKDIPCDGELKIFKLNEVWESYRFNNVLYCLTGFKQPDAKTRFKRALCNEMYLDIASTFIGPEEAKLLLMSDSWKTFNGTDTHKHLVKISYRHPYLERKHCFPSAMPLKALEKRVSDMPLSCKIMWESGQQKRERGEGFNQAYRYDSNERRDVPIDNMHEIPVIDFFAGAGGMGIGFERAGFRVKISVEWNKTYCDTLMINNKDPEHLIFNESCTTFMERCLDEEWDDHPSPETFKDWHFHASPPCQGYSDANRYGGRNDEENNARSFDFIEFIERFRPRTATFENVTGMLTRGLDTLKQIMRRLLAAKYQARILTLNSADYGDPQARNRVFIFAARHDCRLPKAPEPTVKTKAVVRSALSDLYDVAPVESGNARYRIPEKDQGPTDSADASRRQSNFSYISHHTIEGTVMNDDLLNEEVRAQHNNPPIELDESKPAPTLTRGNRIIHPNGQRYLTIRERARLQSFPDDHRFCGNSYDQKSQIGNAVPTGLATAVASSFLPSHRNNLVFADYTGRRRSSGVPAPHSGL